MLQRYAKALRPRAPGAHAALDTAGKQRAFETLDLRPRQKLCCQECQAGQEWNFQFHGYVTFPSLLTVYGNLNAKPVDRRQLVQAMKIKRDPRRRTRTATHRAEKSVTTFRHAPKLGLE
jgi:hypothetical protein